MTNMTNASTHRTTIEIPRDDRGYMYTNVFVRLVVWEDDGTIHAMSEGNVGAVAEWAALNGFTFDIDAAVDLADVAPHCTF